MNTRKGLSEYKIKKILKMYAEDYTATETSKLSKINRNTVNGYYDKFRKILKVLLVRLLLQHDSNVEYMGYFKSEYNPQKFINLYKYSEKLYLFNLSKDAPHIEKSAMENEIFSSGAKFVYSRLSKFYGFTEESYYNQLIESTLRYYYSKEELYELIFKNRHIPLEKIY